MSAYLYVRENIRFVEVIINKKAVIPPGKYVLRYSMIPMCPILFTSMTKAKIHTNGIARGCPFAERRSVEKQKM